jgi:nitrogen fixation/metabolism regulation signal transduction histidine kinase
MGSSPGLTSSRQGQKRRRQRAPFERRVARLTWLLVTPPLVVSGILIWLQPWSLQSKSLLVGAEVVACLIIGAALHEHIIRPLQTLANVVGSLREEDYSFRARLAVPNDALGELSLEVNALADLLAKHRTRAIEATALLQRVVEEVDLPIFTFDRSQRLRLVNSAGEKLLHRPSAGLLGKEASGLGLESCLTCENESLIELHFATDVRWFVRRSSFRQQGVPHTLVVLSDVSRALREEERRAWQRLIRVLGHELNNSLTPIMSIAGSLRTRLSGGSFVQDQRADFERGLNIIETRVASLNRFLQAYRQLAQLPRPVLRECAIAALVARVAALETRVPVTVIQGPELTLMADPDQLEQMLINIIRNAAESVLQSREKHNGNRLKDSSKAADIALSWKQIDRELVLTVQDSGTGLLNPSNVFVPFYTTKPKGSGIGLLLSREIAEAHGGSLELSNRSDGHGCVVTVSLSTEASRRNQEYPSGRTV